MHGGVHQPAALLGQQPAALLASVVLFVACTLKYKPTNINEIFQRWQRTLCPLAA